jgi:DNA-binding NarL/FixJ family response regulator
VRSIRVVVGEIPRILSAIIEGAVTREPDMTLIPASAGDLALLVRRSAADVAIVADERPESEAVHRQVLVDNPRVKILVVTDDGRAAHLLEFRRVPIAEVSPQALVQAIRAAVALGGRPAD